MRKHGSNTVANAFNVVFRKHGAEILTGLGVAGMVAAVAFTVRATIKAVNTVQKKKEEKGEELTKKEVAKSVWKYYVPTGVAAVASAACIIGADSVHTHRNAALAAAYAISETAFQEYQNKVAETIGEKKEQAIRDDICKDIVAKQDFDNDDYIQTGLGTTRCWDRFCGRPFWGDIEVIRKTVKYLNERLMVEGNVSLNELYYELGLPESALGDYLGWKSSDGRIDISFSSQLDNEERPCLVMYYRTPPKYDYDKY